MKVVGKPAHSGHLRRVNQKRQTHRKSKTQKTMNDALIFTKPHANTEAFRTFLLENLNKHSIQVVKTLELNSEAISKKVDEHYALLSRPVALPAEKHNPTSTSLQKFKSKFGEDYQTALNENRILNCKDFCSLYSYKEVHAHWESADAEKVVLAPGVILARLPRHESGKLEKPQYVINGFYLVHREKFTHPESVVFCLQVRFDGSSLPWVRFRKDIIGKTDPARAAEGSIRNLILQNWENLGLKSQPNYGENGVHASAGPVEAARELKLWFEDDFNLESTDIFQMLLDSSKFNPVGAEKILLDISSDVYDSTEDLDVAACAKALEQYA